IALEPFPIGVDGAGHGIEHTCVRAVVERVDEDTRRDAGCAAVSACSVTVVDVEETRDETRAEDEPDAFDRFISKGLSHTKCCTARRREVVGSGEQAAKKLDGGPLHAEVTGDRGDGASGKESNAWKRSGSECA